MELAELITTAKNAGRLWLDIAFFIVQVIIYLFPIIICIILFHNKVVRFLNFHKSIGPIGFTETEVVRDAGSIWRLPPFGAFLFVPNETKALIPNPKNKILKIYHPGEEVIRYPGLRAYVQYVDIRQRTTDFSITNVLTKDRFRVKFKGIVSWQVNDVVEVSKIKDPILEILNVVEGVIRVTTADFDHDELIAHSDKDLTLGSNNESRIEVEFHRRIEEGLKNKGVFRFIHFKELIIRSRKGDPNRTLTKEPTQAEKDAKAALVWMNNRKEVINIEKEITPIEIGIERERAKFDTERIQQMDDLLLERERSRFDLERERLLIQERKSALAPILKIFAHILSSPGSNAMIDSWSMNRMSRLLENVVVKFWEDPDIVTAEYRSGPRPPKDAKENLNYQLADLWIVEGYKGNKLQELPNGSLGLIVFINKKQAIFLYDISGNDPVITRIMLRNSKGQFFEVRNVTLYNNLTLPEIIQKLAEKYTSHRIGIASGKNWF